MNLLTVMHCDTDAMIMLIDSTKIKDWPNVLAWKLIEKLCAKFKPVDTIASAEQLEKRMKSTLKKKQTGVSWKQTCISQTSFGCRIEETLKIAAIVKAGGKQYVVHI